MTATRSRPRRRPPKRQQRRRRRTHRQGFLALLAGVLATATVVAFFVVGAVPAAWLAIATAGTFAAYRAPHGLEAIEAAMKWTAVSAVIAVLVVFDTRTLDVFNVAKFAVVVAAATGIVGLHAARWLLFRVRPVPPGPFAVVTGALVAVTAVATLFSSSRPVSFWGAYGSNDGLLLLVAAAVLALTVAELSDRDDLFPSLSALYFVAGGIVVLYGLVQLHDRVWGGSWDWADWGDATFRGTSIWSTLGNPNHLAGLLAVLFPLGVVLAFVATRAWIRVAATGIAAVAILEALQTTTRGAWLAFLITLPLLVLLMRARVPRLAVMAGLAGAVLAVVAVSALLLSSTQDLARQASSIIEFEGPSTARQRIEFWKAATEMTPDRPVLGHGPDTYFLEFPAYQTEKFVELFGPNEEANGPHNVFFSQLVGTGVAGLLAFLALLAVVARSAARGWRRLTAANDEDGRLLLGATGIAVVAYLVQATFNVQQVALTTVFWFLAAVLVSTAEPRVVDRRVRRLGSRDWAALVAVVVVGLAVAFQTVRPYMADRSHATALEHQQQAATAADPEGELEASREAAERAIDWAPWEPTYREFWAAAMLNQAEDASSVDPNRAVGFLDEAYAQYTAIIDAQPSNASAHSNAGQVLLRRYEVDRNPETLERAVGAHRRAVKHNPWQATFVVRLSSALTAAGEIDEAVLVVEEAIDRLGSEPVLITHLERLSQLTGGRDPVEDTVGS